jgi:Fumarylacetoacetate (FAA) hydrolase family
VRLARVLRCASPGAGDLEPPRPVVALERDGALYDVEELDRCFGTRFDPDRFGAARDFHTRVFALGCVGLADLDERLRLGDRPTEARLLPGTFLWLPPCDPSRSLYVQMDPYAGGLGGDEPGYRFGNARSFLGHDSAVPFPSREERPDFELGLGAILGEDLHRATAAEAERALLGYAVLNAWTARGEELRAVTRARDFAAQLGPVLVTKDEIAGVGALRAQARVDGEVMVTTSIGGWRFHVAEAIAFVSDHVELYAGDVVGAGRVAGGSTVEHGGALRYGARVELRIERLGKLTGTPTRGPASAVWRR